MVKAAKEAILVKTWAERGGSEEDSKEMGKVGKRGKWGKWGKWGKL